MIYICNLTSKATPSTNDFIGRGLAKYTIAPASAVALFGVPNRKQIAYSGYKDNIAAFLYATATKQRVSVTQGHFPLPADYTPSFPDIFPRTIFGLAQKATAESILRMTTSLEIQGIASVVTNKGTAYTLEKPAFTTLTTVLPRIAKPIITYQAGYSQVESSAAIMRVYQCIEAFLATNTYSYKHDDMHGKDAGASTNIGNLSEARISNYYYRECYESKTKKFKYDSNDALPTRVCAEELADLTPDRIGKVSLEHIVTIAKPSPLPSSTSWGSPANVPFVPGLVFPYFAGMLSPDTKHIRDIAGRHFFANFGSPGNDPRDAYKVFRSNINIAATTPQGIILSHILTGVDQALQTQTQLFLLFDTNVYLGFCLLGAEFKVFAHGEWHEPLTAEQLKTELSTITTHDGSLVQLSRLISEMTIKETGTHPMEDVTTIDTSIKLAEMLSKLRVETDDDKKAARAIGDVIGRLNYKGSFRRQRAEDIAWAVRLLTTAGEPLDPETLIFIPRDGWGMIGSREYQILAAFGPRSFSFRNATGMEYRIPATSTETDPLTSEEAIKAKRNYLIAYDKAVKQAVEDWKALVDCGRIRVNFGERAAGSRANRFGGEAMEKIWRELKSAAERGIIGLPGSVPHVSVAALGIVEESGLGASTLDDFF